MTLNDSPLNAEPGDRLVIRGHHTGDPGRDGEILEVLGPEGAPPFVVRWEDDGHVSQLYPGSDAYVDHLHASREAAANP